METKDTTVELRLSQTDFSDAVVCDDKNLIHQVQMDQILEMFQELYRKASNYTPSKNIEDKKIAHNTISIFASRGAGKTTFLLSALKRIREDYKKAVCLQPIDPSIIECKQHPFINIIAAIHQIVEETIRERIWGKPEPERDSLEEYNQIYKKLLKGLPFIDGIGNENIYQNWEDELFISMQGMEKAEASNNLIDSFHEYIKKSLKLLEKDCFVISFDDIDTNFHKGYELLEVIRKYLTTEQIICILTGDLELYGKLVRKASWECFDTDFLEKEQKYAKRSEAEFSTMINHLENQYLLKILKPEFRIQLHTINEVIEEDRTCITVFFSDGQSKGTELDECYTDLLEELNLPINNTRVMSSILRFLKSLSLRSQIRLLFLIKNYKIYAPDRNLNKAHIAKALANIFWNDINQKSINAKKLITPDSFYTVEMQSFLIHNNLLHKGSNFLPLTNDDTLNKALLAIGSQYNIQAEKSSFQIFDFWLRLCYVQYATGTFEGGHDTDKINDFINFSSLNDNDDLTKCIGLAQAYCQREYCKDFSMTGKTMAGTMIVNNYNAILQSGYNSLFTSLLLEGSLNEMQQETVFASIYKLFAAIRDILYHLEIGKDVVYNYNNTGIMLSKLMQYRAYIEPNNIYNYTNTETEFILSEEDTEQPFGEFYDNDDIERLADELYGWQTNDQYQPEKFNISAQLLQRIFTRTYFTMINIDKSKRYTNLGEKMNAYIVGFLNAVLVESAIESNNASVNLNTVGDINYILRNNIRVLQEHNSEKISAFHFYQWLSNCPLLQRYINPYINKIIQGNSSIDTSWELFKYSNIKNKIEKTINRNKTIKNNIRTIDKAIQWIDKKSQLESSYKKNSFFSHYTDNENKNSYIFLDRTLSDIELQQNKDNLLNKKEKYSIEKGQNEFIVRQYKRREKEIQNFIKLDYYRQKSELTFYNYLCSIEIKEAQVISHDSDLN